MPKYTAHLLLGTNMGNRPAYLQFAIEKIRQYAGEICGLSPVYETAAWGLTEQDDFLNQALIIRTEHAPEQLLAILQTIEYQAGRQRLMRWGPRTLDIDIIAIDRLIIHSEKLQVPHPATAERRFVLQPLADLLPEWQHPVYGLTYGQMLAVCPDTTPIKRYAMLDVFDCEII